MSPATSIHSPQSLESKVMKVNLWLRVGQWSVVWASLSFLFLLLRAGQAGQWRNPREVLRDPTLARLQQGRKELTPAEKEELQRYGYTGLEVMTYLHDNRDPGGSDAEVFRRAVNISAQGLIQNRILLLKIKYVYWDYRVLLTRDGVRPGAVKEKGLGIVLFPPAERGAAALSRVYLRSRELNQKREEQSVWLPNLRRPRLLNTSDPQDNWVGAVLTWDDHRWREPWEEEHRILGQDTLRGQACLVIESRHLDPHYYLGRRVTWVEINHFIDLHEEQFDPQGRIWKVADKGWEEALPWGYWAKRYDYWMDLLSGQATALEYFEWRFDQGFKDEEFASSALLKGIAPWREPKRPLLPVKDLSELPPRPQVRQEFWQAQKAQPPAAVAPGERR